jgi:hypothetical protein
MYKYLNTSGLYNQINYLKQLEFFYLIYNYYLLKRTFIMYKYLNF